MISNSVTYSLKSLVLRKLSIYKALAKHKLNMTVVLTSVLGYLVASNFSFNSSIILLAIGGYLVTACANTINQILEKDYDALMKRTMNRPLPTKQITDVEAWLFAGITGFVGLIILWFGFNTTAAMLGGISIVIYAFIYTPLKRIHPIAILVGAIPGAIPPLIGYIAFANTFNLEAGILFLFQFFWQFPHFLAIAWLGYDDYKKAGYKLLPTGYKDSSVPINSIIFILMLILLSLTPFVLGFTSLLASLICVVASTLYMVPAIKLLSSESDKDAKSLMFASFAYIPIIFITLIFG